MFRIYTHKCGTFQICGNKIYKCGTVQTYGNDFRNMAKFKYLETTYKIVAL